MATTDVELGVQQTEDEFLECFNAGDTEGLVALFEPDALVVSETGEQARGADGIRNLLARLMVPGLTLSLRTANRSVREGMALAVVDWRLSGAGPDGDPVEHTGRTATVFRIGDDGRWLKAIFHPFVA